jgi:hypothetical protein
VCQNTLSEALGQGPSIRVAHTLTMENKLKYAADEALETIHQHFDEIGVHFRKMVAFKMSEGDLDAQASKWKRLPLLVSQALQWRGD